MYVWPLLPTAKCLCMWMYIVRGIDSPFPSHCSRQRRERADLPSKYNLRFPTSLRPVFRYWHGPIASHMSSCACLSLHQVRYLKIIEKSGYQALPWVRYITQNGGTSVSCCVCAYEVL